MASGIGSKARQLMSSTRKIVVTLIVATVFGAGSVMGMTWLAGTDVSLFVSRHLQKSDGHGDTHPAYICQSGWGVSVTDVLWINFAVRVGGDARVVKWSLYPWRKVVIVGQYRRVRGSSRPGAVRGVAAEQSDGVVAKGSEGAPLRGVRSIDWPALGWTSRSYRRLPLGARAASPCCARSNWIRPRRSGSPDEFAGERLPRGAPITGIR